MANLVSVVTHPTIASKLDVIQAQAGVRRTEARCGQHAVHLGR